MTAYLLDTSAVLAHFCREAGHVRVQTLFEDPDAILLLAAPSLVELEYVLTNSRVEANRRHGVLRLYGGRLASVVAVDEAVALAAVTLRRAASARLPAMDALIAWCDFFSSLESASSEARKQPSPPCSRLRASGFT